MNPRERLMLTRLVDRIVDQPAVTSPDADAAREISALLKVRPDAPYLLVQRALELESALAQAEWQVEQLRERADARPVPADSAARAWAPAVAPPAPAATVATASGAAPAGGGFLRNAASVGAGVLGGSLLFQGLESLLHGGGGRGLGGGGLFGGSGAAPVQVFETSNLFFDNPSPGSAAGKAAAAAELGGGRLFDDDTDAGGADFDAGDAGWL